MRSEHRTTGDEWDLGPWRRLLCYMQRAGAAKKVKQRSHRLDRRVAKRAAIREQVD
jgi:hypothetical protein